MKLTYTYTDPTYAAADPTSLKDPANPAPYAIPNPASYQNVAISFTLGDMRFTVEPGPGNVGVDAPAELLRSPVIAGTSLSVTGAGNGPHEDFLFLKGSQEYTYHVRRAVGGAMVEIEMSAGAKIGDRAKLVLYKGATTAADIGDGNWTERLVRPCVITAADLANRQTGWPTSGSVPTVDTTKRIIVDNGGDGYAHV